jgi:hypothetical protein
MIPRQTCDRHTYSEKACDGCRTARAAYQADYRKRKRSGFIAAPRPAKEPERDALWLRYNEMGRRLTGG